MKRFILTAIGVLTVSSVMAQPGAPQQEGRRARGEGERPRAAWAERGQRPDIRPGERAQRWRERFADAQTSGPRGRAMQAGERHGLRGRDVPTTRILERLAQYLELTPEQHVKVKEILAKAKSEFGESVTTLREFGEKTRESLHEVLTEEQRAKLDRLREDAKAVGQRMAENYGKPAREAAERMAQEARLRMALRQLNLSEEQRQRVEEVEKKVSEKIRAIQQEVQPKIQAVREEAKKEIEAILTPEQREQLRERLEKMPAGPPQFPQERPGQGPRARRPAGGPPPAPPTGQPQAFGWRPPALGPMAWADDAVEFRGEMGPGFGRPGWDAPPAPAFEPGPAMMRPQEPYLHEGFDGPPAPPAPAGEPPARDILLEVFA